MMTVTKGEYKSEMHQERKKVNMTSDCSETPNPAHEILPARWLNTQPLQQSARVQVLPLDSSVTLGKLYNLSEAQFPPL